MKYALKANEIAHIINNMPEVKNELSGINQEVVAEIAELMIDRTGGFVTEHAVEKVMTMAIGSMIANSHIGYTALMNELEEALNNYSNIWHQPSAHITASRGTTDYRNFKTGKIMTGRCWYVQASDLGAVEFPYSWTRKQIDEYFRETHTAYVWKYEA